MASVLLPAAAGSAFAQTAGEQPFAFLSLDADARAVGLGGAYSAAGRDVNALHYNPAGLGRLVHHEAVFMDNRYLEGVSQQYAAAASKRGWAVGVNHVGYGGMARTTISDPDGNSGSFDASDLALSAGYGRTLFGRLSAGGAVKYIRESLDNVSAQGAAFDAGVLWESSWPKTFRMGLAFQNMGPAVRFQSEKEKLPYTFRFGLGQSFEAGKTRNTLLLDVIKERTSRTHLAVGGEAVILNRMAVRFGYAPRNEAGTGLTTGLGWRLGGFRVDYAFVPYGPLGTAHRFSLGYKWGGPPLDGPGERLSPLARIKRRLAKRKARLKEEAERSRFDPSMIYEPGTGPPEAAPPAPKAGESVAPAPDGGGARRRLGPPPKQRPFRPVVRPRYRKPKTAEGRLYLAERYVLDGDIKKARKQFRATDKMLAPEDKRRIQVFQRLGHLAYLAQEFVEAEEHLKRALALAIHLQPDSPYVAEAYADLGMCMLERGDKTFARTYFKKALEHKPTPALRGVVENTLKGLERGRR